jgi:hypothetical protein
LIQKKKKYLISYRINNENINLVASQTYISKRGRMLHEQGNVESVHAFRHFIIDLTLGKK